MPRPERAVDPSAGPVESFAVELRGLRRQAGNPGYRELAQRAGFSVTVLANAAGGRRLPSLPVTLGFVRACGGDPLVWERRWRQASAEWTARMSAARTARGSGADAGADGADPPYRGLLGYGVADGDKFFGRQRLVTQLVGMLGRSRFVAVFGVSGSGKSSLLRAGLVPALTGATPDRCGCVAVVMTPGAQPLAALRRSVAAASQREVLLVVDQFEELFTLCREPAERATFVTELANLAQQPASRTRVVIGVRADFYARCAELPVLAGLLAGTSLPVGPLDADELREVVTEPARLAGLRVERALVAKVLADAAGQPGALPLVSHALLETWRQRRTEMLTLTGYEAAGGVAGAVAQTAETVYQRFDAGQKQTAERLLIRLVTLGDESHSDGPPGADTGGADMGGHRIGGDGIGGGGALGSAMLGGGVADTRRRVARAELDFPDADAVLHRLADARLVVLGPDTVELAHEALIGAWPRLHGWLHGDREALRLHRQLTDAAQIWRSHGMDAGALYRGLRLAAWEGRDPHRLNPQERAFLTASRAWQARQQRAGRRRVRLAVAGLTATVTAVSVLAAAAVVQAGRARAERDLAYSRQLVAEARTQLQVDPQRGLLLARQAYQVRPTEAAEAALRQALVAPRAAATLTVSAGGFAPLAISRDGTHVAVAHGTATIEVWHVRRGTVSARLAVDGAPVTALAVSPDGRRIAVGARDGRVRIWDLRTGTAQVVNGPGAPVDAVGFSPDGRRLAAGGVDGTVRVSDTSGGTNPVVLRGHRGRVRVVAFSPDGRWIAGGGDDGTVRIWPTTGRAAPVRLDGHGGAVWSVAFSPDGRRLVSGHDDGTARVWHTRPDVAPILLRTSIRLVRGVAFSPDGQRVATTGTGGTIHLWDAASPTHPLELRGHTHSALAVTFTADGQRLVSAAADGTARLWDTGGRAKPTILGTPGGVVRDVAFSPDGRRVATAAIDGTVHLWPTAGPRDPVVLRGHHGPVRGVVFHPDGTRLATGDDGTIRIWDLTRGRETTRLPIGRAVRPIGFSADGRRLATTTVDTRTGLDTHLQVWNTSGLPTRETDPYRVEGYGVAFSPDGHHFATAGRDGTVRIRNTLDGADRAVLRGHSGPVYDIAFSPEGQRIATASQDGTIHIWTVDGTIAFTLPGHPGGADTVRYTANGRWLVSTGTDETVRIWKANTPTEPVVFGGYGPAVTSVTINHDGTQVATLNTDGTARLWPCDVCGPIERFANQR